MTPRCRRCIDYYLMERRRLEAINDLKGKNEGFSHAFLKSEMCELMREIGHNSGGDFLLETEAYAEGIGKVDVLATIGKATIAIECGTTNPKKIGALKERFDIVLHVPYCYTGDLYHLNKGELDHQIMSANLFKMAKANTEIKELGYKVVKGKTYCLEDGECSLPSGRDGFPHEAIQIAAGHTKDEQKQ